MRKKMMFIIISSLILTISIIGIFSFASTDKNGAALGDIFKKYKVDKEIKDDKTLVKVGDIEIKKSDIEYQKESSKASGVIKSDKDIINEILGNKLMLREAEKAGISIDDNTVKKYMDDLRNNLPRDEAGYEEYKQFIANSGWTEDEYWEKAFPVYKDAYIIGK